MVGDAVGDTSTLGVSSKSSIHLPALLPQLELENDLFRPQDAVWCVHGERYTAMPRQHLRGRLRVVQNDT